MNEQRQAPDYVSIGTLARELGMNWRTLANVIHSANRELHGTLAVRVGHGRREHWRVSRAGFSRLGIAALPERATVPIAEFRALAARVGELEDAVEALNARMAAMMRDRDRPSGSTLRTA